MKFRDLIKQTYDERVISSDIVLLEATFSEKKIVTVVKLYAKLLGKKMGGTFMIIGFEDYNRAMGKGRGVRLMNEQGVQLRFNWDAALAKQTSLDLTSLDYWDERNTNFQKPTRTVKFGANLNVVQVLDEIAKALLTGKVPDVSINEARTPQEKQEWLVSKGLPKSLAGSEKGMRDRAAKVGLSEELEVFLGQAETNTFEANLKKSEEAFSSEVYANPETVFEDIEDLLSVVAAGKWRTLVVCGMGGIGKCLQGEQKVNIRGLDI